MLNELESAKNFAFRLIKFRIRSRHELESRLKRKKFSQEIIKQVLDFLSDLGYVNDLTFAKAWVNGRLQFKPRSKKLLIYELKKKGIAANIIETALSGLDLEMEEQLARQLMQKRVSKLNGLPRETKRRRLSGYLARRGFASNIIYQIIRELDINEKQ